MSQRTLWILLLAAALLVAAFYVVPTLSERGTISSGSAGGPSGGLGGPQLPAVVETAPIEEGELVDQAEFVGTLRANAAAELYAKVTGQIVEVDADTSDRVQEGQLLARLEDDEQTQRLAQARAALTMAEATVVQRQAALTVARVTAERTRSLLAQNLVPEQQKDDAEAQLLAAQAQVEVARAQVAQAAANLSTARVELDRTRVVAPFRGFIGKRYLDPGARADASSPLFSLVDLSVIKTTVPLTERDAARVQVGQTATVLTESYPDRVFEGRVARLGSVFDPQTHTTEAEIEIANPDALLKPGMFATVAITFGRWPDVLLVPHTALLEDERETWLFLAEEEPLEPGRGGTGYRARRIVVETLGSGRRGERQEGARVGVASPDLAPGQRVITLGQEGLADGAPIVVADAPRPPAPPGSSTTAERSAD